MKVSSVQQTKVPFVIHSTEEIISVFNHTLQRLREARPKVVLSSQALIDLKTAFVEGVANAIKHAGELKRRHAIAGHFVLNDKTIGFDIVDHGRGFSLNKVPVPNLADLGASGRGVFMMRQLGDVLTYRKLEKHNLLVFRRHLVGQDASARELDLFYDLSEAMIRNASLADVYALILDHALALFHVERASILIFDPSQKSLKMVASRGISSEVAKKIQVKSGEGVSGYVFRHGRPLLIEDVTSNKRGIEQKKHYKTRSFISAPMICSPLRLDEKPVGVINLTDRVDGKKFTKKDLKLLSTIANQAMACLHIRDLVGEVKAAEGLRTAMEQVRSIQASYLPEKKPSIPGFDVSGHCAMAQAAGGDYFDCLAQGPYVFVIVADVSGHDVRSALTMVNLRSRLSTLLAYEQIPSRILTRLNQLLFADLSRLEQFVSCLLMRFNTETGEYLLANAGHYPPLFCRLPPPSPLAGLVLGVNAEEVYVDVSGRLEDRDCVLLYTDGVIETLNTTGQMFGMERLKQFMKKHAGQNSEAIISALIQEVAQFSGTKKQSDDVTAVVVRRQT